MVGIVSLHLGFEAHRLAIVDKHVHRTRKNETTPSTQAGGSTFAVTEDHVTAPKDGVAVMSSSLTIRCQMTVRCQRQRLSFIRRGAECLANPPKALVFQGLICKTAVPTGKAHRLPKKFAVFIGANPRSQGWPQQKTRSKRTTLKFDWRPAKMVTCDAYSSAFDRETCLRFVATTLSLRVKKGRPRAALSLY
jgi:hypothetical protein